MTVGTSQKEQQKLNANGKGDKGGAKERSNESKTKETHRKHTESVNKS